MFRNLSRRTIETSFLADQRRGLNSLNSASGRDHCHCSIGFRFSIFIYGYVQFSMFAVQFMFSLFKFYYYPCKSAWRRWFWQLRTNIVLCGTVFLGLNLVNNIQDYPLRMRLQRRQETLKYDDPKNRLSLPPKIC